MQDGIKERMLYEHNNIVEQASEGWGLLSGADMILVPVDVGPEVLISVRVRYLLSRTNKKVSRL